MKKYLIALILIIIVAGAAYIYWQNYKVSNTDHDQVACTMEAKLCPDSVTYVGRQGPKCEFTACPVADSGMLSILSVTPSSGPAGTVVVLKGHNFTEEGKETFIGISESGQQAWNPEDVSSEEIKFTIPKELSVGPHDITVSISSKQTPTSNPVVFTVTAE